MHAPPQKGLSLAHRGALSLERLHLLGQGVNSALYFLFRLYCTKKKKGKTQKKIILLGRVKTNFTFHSWFIGYWKISFTNYLLQRTCFQLVYIVAFVHIKIQKSYFPLLLPPLQSIREVLQCEIYLPLAGLCCEAKMNTVNSEKEFV